MGWEIQVERLICNVSAVGGKVVDDREYHVRVPPEKRQQYRKFHAMMTPEQAEEIGRKYLEAAEKARVQNKEIDGA
jgi:hypothetical protein